MSSALRARAARLLCVGFPGRAPSAELRELVRAGVRSAILFARNVGEPEELAALTRELKASTDEPFLIAVDQEGGNVRRLRRGFSDVPAMRAIGDSTDPTLAEAVGFLLGHELRAVGIDWDLAPVLDVDSNPNNPVIGARSFSADPARVAKLGVELAAGLARAGVAGCGKHFPGHGDTELDSHFHLPRLTHDLTRLSQVELVPFAAACRAGIPSIMVAHVVFSALDPDRPASMSRAVVRGLLRGELDYRGLVVSDDLEMQAIVDHFGVEQAVIQGAGAGVDLFLVCHEPARMHQAIDALVHGVESGAIARTDFEAAEQRAIAFQRRWAAPVEIATNLDALSSPELDAIRARIAALG